MKVSFTLTLLILFFSCKSIQNRQFLESCQLFVDENKSSGYCESSLGELKKNLPGGQPLFYIGSDKTFDYFVFYSDKMSKFMTGFKIVKGEMKVSHWGDLPFDSSNYLMKDFPVYLNKH